MLSAYITIQNKHICESKQWNRKEKKNNNNNQCLFVTVRARTAYRKICRLVNNFCSHNKVDCSEIPIVLSNLLYHYFFIELWHILNLWLAKMSRPNLRIVSKLTTDVVTYRYCTEASNQKSKYAYRKIFLYKKSTVITYLHIATSA